MRLTSPDQLSILLIWIAAIFLALKEGFARFPTLLVKHPLLAFEGWWSFIPLVLLCIAALRSLGLGRAGNQELELVKTFNEGTEWLKSYREERDAETSPAEPVEEMLPREYLDKSPERIMTEVLGLTDAKAKAATAGYLGKWMKVDGAVYDVSALSGGGKYLVHLGVPRVEGMINLRPVMLNFAVDPRGFVAGLDRNDEITVEGRIDRINSRDVRLIDCELIPYRKAHLASTL